MVFYVVNKLCHNTLLMQKQYKKADKLKKYQLKFNYFLEKSTLSNGYLILDCYVPRIIGQL